jgi:ubiquinone/menaquinone biosynthesis C-methylase UbiE
VLEIGPGVGYYSLEALRVIGEDGRLICLDIQPEMLQEVRQRVSRAAAGEACFVQGSATRLPLSNSSVDQVFLITVLGELPDRSAALGEIRRVLRPGGRLSVSEQLPDPDYLTPRVLRSELSAAGFIEESTRGLVVYTSTWRTASNDEPAGHGSRPA